MSDDREWIKARDAAHLLFENGSPMAANRRMIDPLKYGRIEGRALDGTLEHRRTGRREVVRDWIVPATVWSDRWDQSSMILFEGSYSTRDYASGYAHVKLSGLAFDRAQFLEYFDIADASSKAFSGADPVADGSGRPGRGVDTQKWGTLIAAFAAYQVEHGVDLTWTASKLHDELKGFLNARGGKDTDIPHYSKCGQALNRALWWMAGREGEPDNING